MKKGAESLVHPTSTWWILFLSLCAEEQRFQFLPKPFLKAEGKLCLLPFTGQEPNATSWFKASWKTSYGAGY